jgi:hypothetical protein
VQQSVRVALTKFLSAELGNALVVVCHEAAELRCDVATVSSGHHAATVEVHCHDVTCGSDERCSSVAPATQGVIDVMQDRVRHGGAHSIVHRS